MKTTASLGLCVLALGICASAAAVPTYTIKALGLADVEHTTNTGKSYSNVTGMNKVGQFSGVSDRRNGGITPLGLSAWFYDGNSTIKIGLFGAEHTRNDGYKSSNSRSLNEMGQVLGTSSRYNGVSSNRGLTTWLFDGATTVDIGLTGPEHTTSYGYKYSYGRDLNAGGQAIGYSERYNGGSQDLGSTAWQFAGGTTTVIGLTGPEYTRNDGFKHSIPSEQNAAGHVVGSSRRFVGSVFDDNVTTTTGYSAWLYDGNSSKEIGFTSAEYSTNNGYRSSSLSMENALNEVGMAIGSSVRYNGGISPIGRTAWLFDGATTLPIGLTGSEYTSSSGWSESNPQNLNDAGQAVGYSHRYIGASSAGQTAWLYDGNSTFALGLSGPQYTSGSGQKYSSTTRLNNAGQVVGVSYRYSGNTQIGAATWLYADGQTTQIGPTSAEYIRYDGFTSNGNLRLYESGHVTGTARRYYEGNAQYAVDAWFYEPELNQTIVLPTPRRSDGNGSAEIAYMREDGVILGYYDAYSAADAYLGNRVFYYTIEDGLHDLGPLVQGGLDENGWKSLASALYRDESGRIVGQGDLTNGSQMAYLLTPVSDLQGDFNQDGMVDAGDYTAWRDGLGSLYTQAHYEVWKTHFGQTPGSSSSARGASANTAVPEPSALSLAALFTLGWWQRKRR